MKRVGLVGTCLYISCVGAAPTGAAQQEVTKVFFHEGELRDRIVLQFLQKPQIQELPAAHAKGFPKKQTCVVCFIPDVTLFSAEARGTMTAVNRIKKPHYTIALTPVSRPQPGLEIKVTYDPDMAAFSYGTFDSITTQKCITFNFDDKNKLDLLEKKSKPLHTLASAGKPKVMLDYGHGGSDTGKIAQNGVQEKDITAQVGAQVKALLQQKGYDVLLTRPVDRFVQLDERTTRANKERVDLFVSLHANASRKPQTVGLETYWAGQQLVMPYSYGDNRWLARAYQRDEASREFATVVHSTILQEVRPLYQLFDRKVRASGAQVLFATDMPSILVELGFLSNPLEADKLAQRSYQNLLAQGISKGVDTFYTKYVQA
jgi:N-acetylmuramoyl-L-alanine amidase